MRSQVAARLVLLLSLIGLGLAGYLYYIHLGLLRGELLGGAACSGTGALNCHAVTASRWSAFLGMPLALWGVLGYLTVFALALTAQHIPALAPHALTAIFGLCVLFVVADLVLLGLMVMVIRLYCLLCLFSYVVNGLLLLLSGFSLGRPWLVTLTQVGPSLGQLLPSRFRPGLGLLWGMLVFAAFGTVGVHAATTFMHRGSLGSMRTQMRDYITKQPRWSVDAANDPTLGIAHAPMQIVEFSDFLCPSCQRASRLNPILLAGHRRDVAFHFKHYPLDTECNAAVQRTAHPGACKIAAASECAHQQGKFWPFHDLVFVKGRQYRVQDIDQDAAAIGVDLPRFRACMDSGEGMEAVKADAAQGAKAGVTSTPTYVINGIPVIGGFSSPAMFEEFIAALRDSMP